MPRRLPQLEFTILLAVLFATVAFSIDAMLPGLPDIAAELSPDAPNRAQLVLTSFVFGMGFGTLLSGPFSDHFGRKPLILSGLLLYAIGATIAGLSSTMEGMLIGRAIQGFGAAVPRTVGIAMVRDLYEGREMAKITSFVMTIFMIAPAAAPSVGAFIIAGFGWHGIFAAFVLIALFSGTWLALRQGETLTPENHRKLNWADLWEGTVQVLGNYNIRLYIMVLVLGFGQMFSILSSVQQIYEDTFDLADSFPLFFGLTAVISAVGAILNGRLVTRLGMHFMIRLGYGISLVGSVIALVLNLTGLAQGRRGLPALLCLDRLHVLHQRLHLRQPECAGAGAAGTDRRSGEFDHRGSVHHGLCHHRRPGWADVQWDADPGDDRRGDLLRTCADHFQF